MPNDTIHTLSSTRSHIILLNARPTGPESVQYCRHLEVNHRRRERTLPLSTGAETHTHQATSQRVPRSGTQSVHVTPCHAIYSTVEHRPTTSMRTDMRDTEPKTPISPTLNRGRARSEEEPSTTNHPPLGLSRCPVFPFFPDGQSSHNSRVGLGDHMHPGGCGAHPHISFPRCQKNNQNNQPPPCASGLQNAPLGPLPSLLSVGAASVAVMSVQFPSLPDVYSLSVSGRGVAYWGFPPASDRSASRRRLCP